MVLDNNSTTLDSIITGRLATNQKLRPNMGRSCCHSNVNMTLKWPHRKLTKVSLPVVIYEIYILEVWELGDILRWQMNDFQAPSSEKRFVSPRQGSNPQPSNDWWDALTIEPPGLRGRAKVQVWHVRPKRKPLYVNNDIDEIYILKEWELGDILRWQMNDRQAPSSEKRFLGISSQVVIYFPRAETAPKKWGYNGYRT